DRLQALDARSTASSPTIRSPSAAISFRSTHLPNPSTILGRQLSAHTRLTRRQLWRAETPLALGHAPRRTFVPCIALAAIVSIAEAQPASVFASSGDGGRCLASPMDTSPTSWSDSAMYPWSLAQPRTGATSDDLPSLACGHPAALSAVLSW